MRALTCRCREFLLRTILVISLARSEWLEFSPLPDHGPTILEDPVRGEQPLEEWNQPAGLDGPRISPKQPPHLPGIGLQCATNLRQRGPPFQLRRQFLDGSRNFFFRDNVAGDEHGGVPFNKKATQSRRACRVSEPTPTEEAVNTSAFSLSVFRAVPELLYPDRRWKSGHLWPRKGCFVVTGFSPGAEHRGLHQMWNRSSLQPEAFAPGTTRACSKNPI